MKKVGSLVFIFLLVPFVGVFALFQKIPGIEDVRIKRVVISEINPLAICVASDNTLYKSKDGGEHFKKINTFEGEQLKHIFFDSLLADIIYAVTEEGVYKVEEQVNRIFSVTKEEQVLTAEKYRGRIYVGTSEGVYLASGDILNWQKLKGVREVSVYDIEPAGNQVYFAASNGVYSLSLENNEVKRLFVLREAEDAGRLVPQVIKVDVFNQKIIFLGTSQGIFLSKDKGESWNKFYVQGLHGVSVNCIAQTVLEEETVYVGTSNGFFKVNFKTADAQPLYEGLVSSSINWVAFSPSGVIYLATGRGVFKNTYFTVSSNGEALMNILRAEPDIKKVQQAAMRYNGVHPEKIKKWTEALKYRALLPELKAGIGKSEYDRMVYDGNEPQYDRFIRYSEDLEWDVSVSWDLDELIWNSYEDNVDTRSRLMTKLRLDILDEVNRLYFERLRLKNKILSSSLSQEELFQKKLRLKELTAILDAYTGGYFSRKVKEAANDS